MHEVSLETSCWHEDGAICTFEKKQVTTGKNAASFQAQAS